jgi:hypothetical protein
MRERGLPPPDKADAVLGAILQAYSSGAFSLVPTRSRRLSGLFGDENFKIADPQRGGLLLGGFQCVTTINSIGFNK